jgi:tetraacyldisaccharide-1-P 4'-kinase
VLSTAGAVYAKVITEALYTVVVRVRSMTADPDTENAVTGFGTPSTFTSKLDSAGGLVESTLQAHDHVIFSMM